MGLKSFIKKLAERTGITDEIRQEERAKVEQEYLQRINALKKQVEDDVRVEYQDCIVVRKGETYGLIHKSQWDKYYLQGWRKAPAGLSWQQVQEKDKAEKSTANN